MGNLFFVSSWRRFKSKHPSWTMLNLEILLSDPIVLMGVRPWEHWSMIRRKISAKTWGLSASNDTTHPRNLFWVLLIVITSHDATKHVLRSQVPVWLMKKIHLPLRYHLAITFLSQKRYRCFTNDFNFTSSDLILNNQKSWPISARMMMGLWSFVKLKERCWFRDSSPSTKICIFFTTWLGDFNKTATLCLSSCHPTKSLSIWTHTLPSSSPSWLKISSNWVGWEKLPDFCHKWLLDLLEKEKARNQW